MSSSVYKRVGETLIGKPGGRAEIPTPALVIDLPAFEANLARMAAHCKAEGLGLRPHAKTHKCAEIARRQLAAGAIGICCAKLAEAEALAAEGIQKILLTSPLVTQGSIARAVALNAQIEELIIVVDHPDGARDLDVAARAADKPVRVLIDVDVGLHRTGMELGQDFEPLARLIDDAKGLTFCGLQGYAGHLMHLEDTEQRTHKSLEVMDMLASARERAENLGMECPIISGGGTGTFDIDPQAGVLTDLQGGSYVFMDRQYGEVPTKEGHLPFAPSLFVQMTVISANTPGLVTTDAGFKAFATDADAPVLHSGAPEGAAFFFFGDEQGGVALANKDTDHLPRGAVLSCIVPHCDPTVNLYDAYYVVDGDRVVDIWPIEARGASQ